MESPGPERPRTQPCPKPQAASGFPMSAPRTSLLRSSPCVWDLATRPARGCRGVRVTGGANAMTIRCWAAGPHDRVIGGPSSATCLGDTNVHSRGLPAAPVPVTPLSMRVLADTPKAPKVTCALQPLLSPGQVHQTRDTTNGRRSCECVVSPWNEATRQGGRTQGRCPSADRRPAYQDDLAPFGSIRQGNPDAARPPCAPRSTPGPCRSC